MQRHMPISMQQAIEDAGLPEEMVSNERSVS